LLAGRFFQAIAWPHWHSVAGYWTSIPHIGQICTSIFTLLDQPDVDFRAPVHPRNVRLLLADNLGPGPGAVPGFQRLISQAAQQLAGLVDVAGRCTALMGQQDNG